MVFILDRVNGHTPKKSPLIKKHRATLEDICPESDISEIGNDGCIRNLSNLQSIPHTFWRSVTPPHKATRTPNIAVHLFLSKERQRSPNPNKRNPKAVLNPIGANEGKIRINAPTLTVHPIITATLSERTPTAIRR